MGSASVSKWTSGEVAIVPWTPLNSEVPSSSCVVFFEKLLTMVVNPHKCSYVLFCNDSLLLGNDGQFGRTIEPVKMSPCSAKTPRFYYSLTQSLYIYIYIYTYQRNGTLSCTASKTSEALLFCIKFEEGRFPVWSSPQACKDREHILVPRGEVRMGQIV